MDINRSALSKNKTNRTQVDRNSPGIRSTIEAAGAKTSTARQAVPAELKAGQQVRGEITDHRFGEISIRLGNSNQTVTARLDGDVVLSIGQEAQFEVIEVSSGHMVLKYLPEAAAIAADSTIQKALSASGFPFNDRNRAIVEELLNHRMSIDKATLQSLIRHSNINREASPLTLVLMLKYKIPMTSEHIRQFETYQQGTHSIIGSLESISEQLTAILSSGQPSHANQSLPMTNTATGLPPSEIVPNADSAVNTTAESVNHMNEKLLDILYPPDDNVLSQGAGASLSDYLDSNQLHLLNRSLDQLQSTNSSHTGAAAKELFSGNESPQRVILMLRSLLTQTEKTLTPEFLLQTINKMLQPEQTVLQDLTRFLTTPASLPETSLPQSKISDFLSSMEREALIKHMSLLPVSGELKEQILQGSALAKDTLMHLNRLLNTPEANYSLEILQSREYRSLLKGAFLNKWTITPESLIEENSLQKLYQGLQEDAEKLSMLTQAGNASTANTKLLEPVKQLKDNLQFLKALNEMFTYVQLPVDLKDQKLHSDLYVFTNKKSLRNKSEPLSVLLHLDMANLGSMNIHIRMLHKNLQMKFMVEQTRALELIKANLSQIEEALKKKGYHTHTEVEGTYEKLDFSRDFIEQSTDEQVIHRYTFDIRA